MPIRTPRKRVIVITGASAGVGRATARALARQGHRIGLIAREPGRLESTARDVRALGGLAHAVPCDVADADAVERAATEIERRFGPIDVWINNAMVSVFSPVAEMTPAEFKRVCEVTYLGQVYGALAALKRMRPRNKGRGRGKIVFVGSALAYRGIPLQSAYCAAKHAVQGFVDSLRTELLHENSGISITMVQLPGLNTPQFRWTRSKLPRESQPVPPIFQPEIAADAIVHAAFHDRREIFVGLPTVKAIIGNKLAPWYADRYLARKGVESQLTDEPRGLSEPDNLFEAPPGDPGAHGVFDDQARAFSLQAWATLNRGLLLSALGVAAVGMVAAGLLSTLGQSSVARTRGDHR